MSEQKKVCVISELPSSEVNKKFEFLGKLKIPFKVSIDPEGADFFIVDLNNLSDSVGAMYSDNAQISISHIRHIANVAPLFFTALDGGDTLSKAASDCLRDFYNIYQCNPPVLRSQDEVGNFFAWSDFVIQPKPEMVPINLLNWATQLHISQDRNTGPSV